MTGDGSAEGHLERARQLYEQGVFDGDEAALAIADRELDAVEAALALARGRNIHTKFLTARDRDPAQAVEDPAELPLFERSRALYQSLGDTAGEADALFWLGCFHQVVRGDDGTAVPLLERSLALATQAGATSTMSEDLRHLGIAAQRAGHLDQARAHLEESNRLRREAGFLPGVASNLIGLAYIAAAQNRPADGRTHLDEATTLATTANAHRILHHIIEARTHLQ
jgi:tetratricopeptide (TPR) repeat protein